MKTFLRVAAVVFILLLALPFVLQLRFIEVKDGKTELLYLPLDGYGAGGSIGVYLRVKLRTVYGEQETAQEFEGMWQGKKVLITDVPQYDLQYMGRELLGTGQYLECTVVTQRTVKDVVSGENLAGGLRISTVLGYDDGDFNSEVPAYILWETLTEEYHGSGFDAVPAA